jgi:UDPglucose 6-dehydrogenase
MKSHARKPTVAVVGSGVVGTATGKGFIDKGHPVIFIDVNEKTVQKLRGEGVTAYTPAELASGKKDTSVITLLTVSTPTENGEINLRHLQSAVTDLGKRLARKAGYHLVVVRSTVPPGTSAEIVIPLLEQHSGKKAGKDFGVCMNPEYLREVSAAEDFKNPWIIVFGQLDKRSGDTLAETYAGYACPIHRVSLAEAEFQKYVHNLFNAAKISFFNEMRGVGRDLDLDTERIFALTVKSCEGLWNAPYGTKDLGPFSGMCLPKDTQAFLAWARERNYQLPHLSATIAVNNALLAKDAKRTVKKPVRAQSGAIFRVLRWVVPIESRPSHAEQWPSS